MAQEIERKFLVGAGAWRAANPGLLCRQGYLSSAKERVVRARIAGDKAYLTLKGPNAGFARLEFEYEIPVSDAVVILDELCERPLIEKTRRREAYAGHVWEIDEFHGDNQGLAIAEIELKSADESFERPPWLGAEVSGDPRYFNSNLVANPYARWKK